MKNTCESTISNLICIHHSCIIYRCCKPSCIKAFIPVDKQRAMGYTEDSFNTLLKTMKKRGATMADAGLLRQENTALLRRAMQDGVFSKNELARQTGLSFPTVGTHHRRYGRARRGTGGRRGGFDRRPMRDAVRAGYALPAVPVSAAGAGYAALVHVRPRRRAARAGRRDLSGRCARTAGHASDACQGALPTAGVGRVRLCRRDA